MEINNPIGNSKPQNISKPKEIFSNEFLRLYSVKADFINFSKDYYIVDKGTRVGVILVKEQEILLVRQYRLLINDFSWELPGGGINKFETPRDAAIRECEEEAGVKCLKIDEIFNFHQGIDTTLSPAHIFLSKNFKVNEKHSNNETDQRKWFKFYDVLQMVIRGDIKDSMTITSVLFYSQQNGAQNNY